MNHNYIEVEFIIEKFIAGELDRETRRVFFEHALNCPVCCKRVYLAGKVDEAILVAKEGWKKQIVTEPTKRRLVITYSAVAAFIIFAFIGGYYFNSGSGTNKSIVETKQDTTQEETNQPVIVNMDTLKITPEKPKQIIKKSENRPIQKEEKPKEYYALADAGYNLSTASQLLSIDAGVHTKGIGSSEIDKNLVLSTIADQSSIFNQFIDIEKPSSGEVLKVNQLFNTKWKFQNTSSMGTVIIINQKKQEVVCSYKDIKDSEYTLQNGLPRGSYYLVVYEQGTKHWHAVDFEVK